MAYEKLLQHLKVDPREFDFQFRSHPDFPSALAFSDTLNFLGFANEAYQLEHEFWEKLPGVYYHLPRGFCTCAQNRKLVRTVSKGKLTHEEFLQALEQWFEQKNEKALEQKYGVESLDEENLAELYAIGRENFQHGFNFTPAILINGYRFPEQYDRDDLKYFINDLLEDDEIL